MRRALIFGATGQDGRLMYAYLTQLGYHVTGCRRFDIDTVRRNQPHEIYCLDGIASVAESFRVPAETYESIVPPVWRLLEIIRATHPDTRVCFAGSSEAFGDIPQGRADERHPSYPVSPYGQAKAVTRDIVASYRTQFGVFACTAILFNHTSHLQRSTFLIPRIVTQARTSQNPAHIVLGNTAIQRDWGWAPDYVRAMHAMLTYAEPDDYVVATGETHTVQDLVDGIFTRLNLPAPEVVVDPALFRPHDLQRTCGDATKLQGRFDWHPTPFTKTLDYVLTPPVHIW